MHGRVRALTLLLLVILVGSAGRATAQSASSDTNSASRGRSGWLIGPSVGVPGYGRETDPEFFTIGVNFTQMQPGRLGGDLAIGTMPRLLAVGLGVVGVRGGFALPLAVGQHVLLIPSAGVSLLGAAGVGGSTGLMGLNGGVATILWAGRVGIRTGVTWHHFENQRGALWLLEFGLVGATGQAR